MVYNNGFPMTYQYLPQLQQQIPIQQQPPNQQSNSLIWVEGEAGAKAWPVGNGSSVLLMDSEDNYFYIKSADQSGMPSTRKFRYEEVTEGKTESPQATPTSVDYVTRDEFEQRLFNLMSEINAKTEVKEEIDHGKQSIQNTKRR